MNTYLILLLAAALTALACVLALRTGLARYLFFQLYAFVKGDEILGTAILHTPPKDSPYQRWLQAAGKGLPLIEGLVLHDIEHTVLRPWPMLGTGITGLYLHFADYQMLDAQIVEIPAQGAMNSQRHLYEKGIYVLNGIGYTCMQQEGKPDRKVEWNKGDLFSIPLNVKHQHYNTGAEPVRMLMVTTFPLLLNLFDDESFIDNSPGVFTGRYNAEPDYLDVTEELDRLELSANFVRDVRSTPARQNDFRGKGNRSIRWRMAGNSMLSMHVSEIPQRQIKKAHRINSNAFLLVLSGSGFSVLWREGRYESRTRIDWQAGTLFSPPVFWYQQHLNVGDEPLRYLAINLPGYVRNLGLHFEDQLEVDLPQVKAEWKRELEKLSARSQ